jgi:hypothetical protein
MNRVLFAFALAIVSAILLALSLGALNHMSPHFRSSGGGDYLQYAMMVGSPLHNEAAAPWRYRPFLPALAGIAADSGMPLPRAFLLVSSLAAFASCIVFGYFVKRIGFSHGTAVLGTCLFAVSCGGFAAIRGYGYPDALANLFLSLSGRPLVAAAFATVGVFAKESLLLTVPTIVFLNRGARRFPGLAVVVICPVAAYLVIRNLIPGGQGHSFFSIENVHMVTGYWESAMRHGAMRWCLWSLAYSLGPLWLLAAVNIRAGAGYLWHLSFYVPAVVLPLVLTTDTERALCLLFPATIPVALCGFERFRHRPRVFWTVSLVTVVCVFASSCTFFCTSRWKYATVVLCFVAPLVVLFAFRRYAVRNCGLPVKNSVEPCFPLSAFVALGRRKR